MLTQNTNILGLNLENRLSGVDARAGYEQTLK